MKRKKIEISIKVLLGMIIIITILIVALVCETVYLLKKSNTPMLIPEENIAFKCIEKAEFTSLFSFIYLKK